MRNFSVYSILLAVLAAIPTVGWADDPAHAGSVGTLSAGIGFLQQHLVPTASATNGPYMPDSNGYLLTIRAEGYLPSDDGKRTPWNKWGELTTVFGTANLSPGNGGTTVTGINAMLSKKEPTHGIVKLLLRVNGDFGNDGFFNTTANRQSVVNIQAGAKFRETPSGNIVGIALLGPSVFVDPYDATAPILQVGANMRLGEEAEFGPYVSALANFDMGLYWYGENVKQISGGVKLNYPGRDTASSPIFYVEPQAIYGDNYIKAASGGFNIVRGASFLVNAGLSYNAL